MQEHSPEAIIEHPASAIIAKGRSRLKIGRSGRNHERLLFGRLGEVANDRLGALNFGNSESGRVTGFEKVIWPEWGASRQFALQTRRWKAASEFSCPERPACSAYIRPKRRHFDSTGGRPLSLSTYPATTNVQEEFSLGA